MLQHLLDLIFGICELEWTEFVKWSVDGRSLVLQIDLEFMTHPYRWTPFGKSAGNTSEYVSKTSEIAEGRSGLRNFSTSEGPPIVSSSIPSCTF